MLIRLLIFLFALYPVHLISEQRLIIHEGVEREYIIHVPENLTQDSPIVFVIHGYTCLLYTSPSPRD